MSDAQTFDGLAFIEELIPDEKVREKLKNFDEETIMSLLGQTQVSFGEETEKVIFTIKPIAGWTAVKILEQIRRNFGFQLSNIDVRPGLEVLALLQPLLTADISFVEKLMEDMFASVKFSGNGATNFPLKGKEDIAFARIGPFAVYELLIRCLVINFFPFLIKDRLKLEKTPEEYELELGYKPVAPKQVHPLFVGILASEHLDVDYLDCKYKLTLEEIADLNEVLIAEALNNELAERVAKRRSKSKTDKSSPYV